MAAQWHHWSVRSNNSSQVFHVSLNSGVSANHHAEWNYQIGPGRTLKGSDLCSEWLSQDGLDITKPYPFLCSGLMVGTAASLRRVLRRLMHLYIETREYY